MSDLLNSALGYITQGMSAQEIELQLQNTPEYKQRFAGNAIRIANGLSALSPANYISLEDQYGQVLQSYGLPSGFYDQHSDFTDFIGKGISPSELQSRAQVAYNQYINAPDSMKNLWQQYFGTQGDAIAYILDPDRATSTIQSQGQQVAIGGAAAAAGLSIDQPRAQQFDQAGVTAQQAEQGFEQVAFEIQPDRQIANRFGTSFTQQEAENADILNDPNAVKKRQKLYSEEKGLFDGSGALNSAGLGIAGSTA